MSYIVEQKIKGKIYLYEVESYWDKEKKQARQRRRYIGVKDPETGKIRNPKRGIVPRRVFEFGEIWLLRMLCNRIGLDKGLKKIFGDKGEIIFNLGCYDFLEKRGFYLYKEWSESVWYVCDNVMTSQDVSRFMSDLDEYSINEFQNFWLKRHGREKSIAFDITSISSYSDGLSNVEWGYNRDGEKLPQLNIGIAVNIETGIPVNYRVFPGSIPDVRVLKRLIEEFSLECHLSELIIDRGFFSERNLVELKNKGIDILISVPFNYKIAERVLRTKKLNAVENVFTFNERVLFHLSKRIRVKKETYDAHLFLDEERRAAEISRFITKISHIEKEFTNERFHNIKELINSIEQFCPGMLPYFTVTISKGKAVLERNIDKIEDRIKKMGKMILLSSKLNRTAESILESYYMKDMAEKYFDTLKNEMGDNRLRTHNDRTTQGRIFIAMIGLIIYSALYTQWKKSNFRNKISIPKLLATMRPLKLIQRSDGKYSLSEITKKQRDIITVFNFSPPVIES